VKEERLAHSSLGVSGDFPVADRQIADAPKNGARLPSVERSGDPLKNEAIGAADVREIGMQRER
jgi:hypothetical protein